VVSNQETVEANTQEGDKHPQAELESLNTQDLWLDSNTEPDQSKQDVPSKLNQGSSTEECPFDEDAIKEAHK
jgi:hypothetical protein